MNIRTINIPDSSRLMGLISILFLSLAIAACGNKIFPEAISEDHEAPLQVRDLRAEAGPKGVRLSWLIPERMRQLSGDSEYYFSVQRSELKWEDRSCENCPTPMRAEIAQVDPAHPSPAVREVDRLVFVDANVSVRHAYRYQVALKDRRGKTISFSNPSIAKVLHPPATPVSLSASPSPQGILLQWKEVTRDEQGRSLEGNVEYAVERNTSNQPWEKLLQAQVKGTSYQDSALAPGQIYNYRVVPVLMFEGSPTLGEPALILQIKAPDALPPPPPKSVWIIPSKAGLEVHWTASDGEVGGYHVYRKEGKEIIRLTVSPVQAPPYLDKAVKHNQTYHYAVSTVSPKGDHQEGLLSKWTETRSILFKQ